ncbi:MAG: AAA family ATPase [Alphaproteobacteria bacterium]|nr:AAA family ATPase [Alphaproteobacteria bacterium]
MTDSIRDWLAALELEHLTTVFEEHQIDLRDFALLSDDDLKELGLALGPRRRILNAITKSASLGRHAAAKEGEAAPNSVNAAERRHLTVMFCDLVGSTELSQRLDPEDLRDVMQRYQDAVVGAVARYGGYVANFLGDGVLAYFGWPHAYEDQAERAVRAGLDATAVVQFIQHSEGELLQARVGLASGQVVVGDLAGDAASETQAVTGQTPNLAARLQGIAKPGEVVVDATTRQLIGTSFILEDLGRHNLKGFPETIPVWRATGESAAEGRFEAAHGATLNPIFGREHELGMLRQRWELAKSGRGQIVSLSGEAGIGKSRMMLALAEQISGQHHYRLRYQCSAHHANSAFYPIIRRLERAARFVPEDEQERKLDKLEIILRLGDTDNPTAAPLFAALLSLDARERYGPLEMTPQQLREQLIEALIAQLLALSRKRPVLFVLEDAHWIDPTTEMLLGKTMQRIEHAAVLIVITHRPEYVSPWTGNLDVASVVLNRLDRAQSQAVIRSVGGDALTPQVVDRIIERADGIPIYLEELTKSVIEAGISAEAPGAIDEIPTTLQASLTARLDHLGSSKELAQIGAVIGRSFTHALIASVAGGSEVALRHSLDRIVEAELIYRRGVPPDAIYSFKHSLVQDAAYETLLRAKRRQYHGIIAGALVREFTDQAAAEPEVVARHLSLARQPGQAAEYWLLAGQRAGERSAHLEAIVHLESGLEELLQVPPSVLRDEREFALRIALGASLLTVEGWSAPKVADNYERAQTLSVSGGDVQKLFVALRGLANVFFLNGKVKDTRRLVDRLLAMAEEQDDTEMRLEACRSAGMCALFVGDFAVALENLQRANGMYQRSRHHALAFVYGTDPAVVGLSAAAWANWFLGDPDEALRSSDAALALARDLDHPFSLTYAQSLAASLHQFRRDPEAVLEHADAAIANAEEHDYPYWLGWSGIMRGWALGALGNPVEGIKVLRRGIETYEGTGARQIRPYVLTMLAENYGLAQMPEKGIDALNEAFGPGNTTDVNFFEAEALRIHGELVRQTKTGDGQDNFAAAMKLARRQGARALELRATLSAARAARQNGDEETARTLIEDINRRFDRVLVKAELTGSQELFAAPGVDQR